MRDTKIRWADHSWNFYTGCTQVSPGCDHCYAKAIAERMRGTPAFPDGFDMTFRPHKMREPYSWREPARVFVNSMSDFFHSGIPDRHRDAALDVMLDCDRHVYQILTKRPDRMRAYVLDWLERKGLDRVPDHIWLGVSIETNAYAWRADRLRDVPAVRFVSAEPLLGPLDGLDLTGIDWLIVGGESGTDFRPMDHAWARQLRDAARASGTAFYFKQSSYRFTERGQLLDGERIEEYPPQIAHLERGADGRAEATRRPVAQVQAALPLDL